MDNSGARVLLQPEDAALLELRCLRTDVVAYVWEGVVGNTGPAVGQHVLRAPAPVRDMAIAGDIDVRALGYNEAMSSTTTYRPAAPSSSMAVGHPDYHRVFALTATDGEVAYWANNGVNAAANPFFRTNITYIFGIDLASGCGHNFTHGGRSDCSVGVRQPPCPCNGSAECNFDGCNGKAV